MSATKSRSIPSQSINTYTATSITNGDIRISPQMSQQPTASTALTSHVDPHSSSHLNKSHPQSRLACTLFPIAVSATPSSASISLDRVYLSMHHSKATKAYCNLCHCSFKPDDRTIKAHLQGRQHTDHARCVDKVQVTILLKTTASTPALPSASSLLTSSVTAFRLQVGLVPIMNFAVFFKYIVLALRNEQVQQQQLVQPPHASSNPLLTMLLSGPFELFQPHKLNLKYVDRNNQIRTRRLHNSVDFLQMLDNVSSVTDTIQSRKIVLEVTDWNQHVLRGMEQDREKQKRKQKEMQTGIADDGAVNARKKKRNKKRRTRARHETHDSDSSTHDLVSSSSTNILHANSSTRSTSPSALSSDLSSPDLSVSDVKSCSENEATSPSQGSLYDSASYSTSSIIVDHSSDSSNSSSPVLESSSESGSSPAASSAEQQKQDHGSAVCVLFSADPMRNRCNRNRCPFRHCEETQLNAVPHAEGTNLVPFSFFSSFSEDDRMTLSSNIHSCAISWISNPFRLPTITNC